VYSLFVALGSAAASLAHGNLRRIAGLDTSSESTVVRIGSDFLALISTPAGNGRILAHSDPANEDQLLVDGYISLGDTAADTNTSVLPRLSRKLRNEGIKSALKDVTAGSYNLVYANANTKTYSIVSDTIGSLPLYYSPVDGGLVASTSPVTLMATGLVSDRPDWKAFASWLHFGYTIGSRSLNHNIHVFPGGSCLRWQDCHSKIIPIADKLNSRIPTLQNPDTSVVASFVRNACKRVQLVEGETAHLQSAGMDSRLLLAAWPDDSNPPCFTYGRDDSTELGIAKQVARTRGSAFKHVWPNGDEVADSLDHMFRSNGFMVYPDRYLISKKIRGDGYSNILDGFLGDVLLGGSYFRNDRDFSVIGRLARFATIFHDISISKTGLDSISRTLVKDISGPRTIGEKFPFLSEEFAREIDKYQSCLIEDVADECRRLIPENDSLGLLYRNFLTENRGLHAIAQQGVMCRSHVRPLYPFTNDRELFDTCLEFTPESTAYGRFYIRLFKEHFPDYAKIAYGDSMIALKHSPLTHGIYKLLAQSEAALFKQKKPFFKSSVSPNNWSLWLKNSDKLRDKLSADLSKSHIIDTNSLDAFITKIKVGERTGGGELLHLASIAKWFSQ